MSATLHPSLVTLLTHALEYIHEYFEYLYFGHVCYARLYVKLVNDILFVCLICNGACYEFKSRSAKPSSLT